MSESGFTAALARYVAEGSVDRLPSHAVEAAKELFLDTVGVTFAGSTEPVARSVASVQRHQGGAPQAVVIGSATRTSVTGAALVNGTAAHALDLDDSHHPGFLHPSAVLVPAVLALGEERRVDGQRVIASYLYGLDTIAAVGTAINTRHYELGWHATATIGTLAAAVASAKVLDLSAEQTTVAIGLAASSAGGVRRNFGSMAKPLHAGLAASSGVLAALLAEEGLTAGQAVLEGHRGFFDLYAGEGEWDTAAALKILDHGFELAVEGLGIKRFASCGVTHSPIEAALELREKHALRADDVQRIDLVVNPMAAEIATYADPSTGLEAKFSLPHCVAVALLDGNAALDQFSDERARDPRIAGLRERVVVGTDPEVGLAGHRSFGCRLALTLADGRQVSADVEMARGKFSGERLTYDEVVEKYVGCTVVAGIGAERAESCRELLERLDRLEHVTELADAIHEAGVAA